MSPNLGATAEDANGKIYLGTTNGILVLSGEAYQNKKPKAVIEGLDIYNQEVSFTHPFKLNYNQNNINIHFAGLWFQNPENVNYQLTLENHDESWFVSKNNTYSYSQLPPGDYVFHVKVSESTDFENADEAHVKISISPPFWQTNGFYMFFLALIIFALFSFVKWREKKLKEEKLELEKIIYERTMEIERSAEEIKAQAEEIQGINENLEALVHARTAELEHKNKALEEYAFINAHKLRAPVASILGLINLMKSMPLSEAEKDCLDHLVVSSKKLDEVVNSITQAIERGDYGTSIPPESSEFTE